MFNRKYTVTFIDSKWEVIKKNVKLLPIPRQGEYVFFNGLYHEVVQVIHELLDKPKFFGPKIRIICVVKKFSHQEKH